MTVTGYANTLETVEQALCFELGDAVEDLEGYALEDALDHLMDDPGDRPQPFTAAPMTIGKYLRDSGEYDRAVREAKGADHVHFYAVLSGDRRLNGRCQFASRAEANRACSRLNAAMAAMSEADWTEADARAAARRAEIERDLAEVRAGRRDIWGRPIV